MQATVTFSLGGTCSLCSLAPNTKLGTTLTEANAEPLLFMKERRVRCLVSVFEVAVSEDFSTKRIALFLPQAGIPDMNHAVTAPALFRVSVASVAGAVNP
jgi:hypothetical protein